ncbi:MAG: GDP-mannose 4,6-dehydratase, partial [Phycisphaeraceae bacterium]|nr:GDP-mannose 4,6-dehydratase [Phycisphaeraceae bacterium]
MSDRPILVTGAAGFIGSHLTQRLLAAGRRVVGVDNFCDFYDPADKRRNVGEVQPLGEVTIEEADIRDRGAMLEMFRRHRPDTVVHLAAMAGVRPSIKDPALYTQVNVNGTVHLLDAAAQTKNEIGYAVGEPVNFTAIYTSDVPTDQQHWHYNVDEEVVLDEPA